MNEPLHIVLRCADEVRAKVRYVFDTLLMARGVSPIYSLHPPEAGPWILYGPVKERPWPIDRCVAVAHCPAAWRLFDGQADAASAKTVDGLAAVLPERAAGFELPSDVGFDIVANAFYFLSSWSERVGPRSDQTRRMHANSVFVRLGVPQDIVDRYLDRIVELLSALRDRLERKRWMPREWPQGTNYALVVSHDVDFIPSGVLDVAKQGAKTIVRHLVRHRHPADAVRAAAGLARAVMRGRDPYGCVPEIIVREKALGLRTSFQVAVARRHPHDVNYRIEDDRVRDYLRAITDAGFDLCLHGSYRSTENPDWYVEEVELLAHHLARPLGSRQHFLSFDFDALFAAQERAGIEYDMSMGFPDHTGPRAGFSYPYFTYCFKEDRPYDVLQLSLCLMDVTLRGYMGLTGQKARETVDLALHDLRHKRGCVSAVWHPIVFGGARDPGYDRLFWWMVDRVRATGGLATDGRTINSFWRNEAGNYPSFANGSLA